MRWEAVPSLLFFKKNLYSTAVFFFFKHVVKFITEPGGGGTRL